MSKGMMTHKVVFCWTDISGYMAGCWQALQQQPDIDLFVVAFQAKTESAFSEQLMAQISCRLLEIKERDNFGLVKQIVLNEKPDVIVLSGWLHKPYRQLAFDIAFHNTKFFMGMDTPWQGTWRQRLAPWLLHSYLQRMELVIVPGERSWQYARRLHVSPTNITRGLYGIDYEKQAQISIERRQSAWPRSFLYVGRYTTVKAVDILVEAYQQYRSVVKDPWPLVCCGQGSLDSLLRNQVGIENRGFVQPTAMPVLWRNAGVFLLPSRFDPWPLALVEAAAAGLPIVCTNACGSAVEVVRSGYNGLMIPESKPDPLTRALVEVHQNYDELPVWGERSQQLAEPYSAQVWARQWKRLIVDPKKYA